MMSKRQLKERKERCSGPIIAYRLILESFVESELNLIGDKTLRYQGKNVGLDRLKDNIAQYLQSEGFKVQVPSQSSSGWLIQAQKGGFLSEVISAERALNILIAGQPNDFSVRIGVGKWIQNVAVTAVETLALSEIFLPIDVAEMAWTVHVENRIIKKIDQLIQSMPVPAS
jgi:hypothetical protein